MSTDEMDEELEEMFHDETGYKRYNTADTELILIKLEEILQTLKRSNKGTKSECEEILDKGFVIKEHFSKNSNPNLFGIELDDGRYFVTFKDTMDLLLLYFKVLKKEDIEAEIPRRLLPIFQFLKRNGLIYFDAKDREYKITA